MGMGDYRAQAFEDTAASQSCNIAVDSFDILTQEVIGLAFERCHVQISLQHLSPVNASYLEK
jgi:hypothetical protein